MAVADFTAARLAAFLPPTLEPVTDTEATILASAVLQYLDHLQEDVATT